MGLFEELKRRNVLRMAGLYLVGAWLLVQVASTLFPVFGVPGWALRALVIVLALGFVPALVFAWVFELTPEGIKREREVDPNSSIRHTTATRLDYLSIGLFSVAIVLFVADRFMARSEPPKPAPAASTQAAAAAPSPRPAPPRAAPARTCPARNTPAPGPAPR